MKSNIAKITSIYKRKTHQKRAAKLAQPKVQNPSLRSLSVIKYKENNFLRQHNHSVEPNALNKSRSPDPLPSLNVSVNTSFSYEADLQKLEKMIIRNQSARNGLLQVQTRIMEIGNALKMKKLDKIDELSNFMTRKELKLPQIKA